MVLFYQTNGFKLEIRSRNLLFLLL
jgi:hypothetical protein